MSFGLTADGEGDGEGKVEGGRGGKEREGLGRDINWVDG